MKRGQTPVQHSTTSCKERSVALEDSCPAGSQGPLPEGRMGLRPADGIGQDYLESVKTGLLEFIIANPIIGNQTGPALQQAGPRN